MAGNSPRGAAVLLSLGSWCPWQREVVAVLQSRVLCVSSCWESADSVGCDIGKLFQTRHGSYISLSFYLN